VPRRESLSALNHIRQTIDQRAEVTDPYTQEGETRRVCASERKGVYAAAEIWDKPDGDTG